MSIFTKPANAWASPVNADGTARQIIPHDAQVWGTEVERAVTAFVAGGGIIFASKATMDATLTYAANQMAWVLGDATAANNGVYQKIGASGGGSWSRRGDLPYSFILATNTGTGTPNAIIATTAIPVPTADGGALISVPIVATNTATPVTVSINGTVYTIKTSSGDNPAVGGLTAGMVAWGYKEGTNFRLLSDQASAAVLAQMEALYDDFSDLFLGAKAAAPTLDNDGDALQAGALYYNTTDGILYVYDGAVWQPMNSSLENGSVTDPKVSSSSKLYNRIFDVVWLTDYLSPTKKAAVLAGTEVDVTTELAQAVAATISSGSQRPRPLFLPAGILATTSHVAFTELRNVTWYGMGSNTVQNATRLIYRGANVEGMLVISSCNNFYFDNIEFIIDAAGINSVVTMKAQDLPALSNIKVQFNRCTFRPFSGRTLGLATVWIRNSAETTFSYCNFLGCATALRVGQNLGVEPNTYGNGNVVNTSVLGSTFFGDIILVRGGIIDIDKCFFDWQQTSGGTFASPTRQSVISAGGDQSFRQASVRNTWMATPSDDMTRTCISQGTAAVGLLVENNWFDAFSVAVNVNGLGGAEIGANRFLAGGGATSVGVRIASTANQVAVRNSNDFSALRTAGAAPVDDNRTSAEVDAVHISRRAPSTVTLSTANTWFTAITQNIQPRGRRLKIGYSATVQTNTASIVRARVRLGGVVIAETVVGGSGPASGYVCLSLAPLIIREDSRSTAIACELQVLSVSGTDNVVQANSSTTGGTHLTVEEVE
jgi:hypothetical protein